MARTPRGNDRSPVDTARNAPATGAQRDTRINIQTQSAARPTERTVVVKRPTYTGGNGFSQGLEGFAEFFGKQSDKAARAEEAQTARETAKETATLQRLMATNPDAARTLQESGDIDAFFKSVGHTPNPNVMGRQLSIDALKETQGTFFATQDRSEFRDRMRNLGPSETAGDAASAFLKERTKGMNEQTSAAYTGAFLKFAETDSISIAETRRNAVNKAHADKIKSNTRSFFEVSDVHTIETVEGGIDRIEEGYMVAGDTNRVVARMKAGDDFERMVLKMYSEGDVNADRLGSIAYAGRAALNQNPAFAARIQSARRTAMANSMRLDSKEELQDVQTVTALAQTAELDGSASAVAALGRGIQSLVQKHKRGGPDRPLPSQYTTLVERYVDLSKSAAKNSVGRAAVLNGETFHDNKLAAWAMTPAGHDAVMKSRGITDQAEGHRAVLGIIAKQSGTGLDPKTKGIMTQNLLGQTSPEARVTALRDVLTLEAVSGRPLSGLGRYYGPGAEHLVAFATAYTAGADGLRGTADDTDPDKAIESYDAQLERNAGQLPTPSFLGTTMRIPKDDVDDGVAAVLEKLADERGVDVASVKFMEIHARRALTMAAWGKSHLVEDNDLGGNDSVTNEAVRIMRGKSQVELRVDDDNDVTRSFGPRLSNLPPVSKPEQEQFVKAAQGQLPVVWIENGYSLKGDKHSDASNSRIVSEKQADGTFKAFSMEPGTTVAVDLGDEGRAVFKDWVIGDKLPAAGRRGMITLVVPDAPTTLAEATRPIGGGLHWQFEDGTWHIRNRTVTDVDNILSLQQLQRRRSDDAVLFEEETTRQTLRDAADAGKLSTKSAEDADVSEGPLKAMAEAHVLSVKGGALFDRTGNTFISDTAKDIRKYSPKTSTPVTRSTNLQAASGPDRIIGYGFSLDREGADNIIARAGLVAKNVRKGAPLDQAQMARLQQESIHDTLVTIRKHIGVDAMAAMSREQLSTLVGLVETGRFSARTGRSNVMTSEMVRALREGDYDRVFDLIGNGIVNQGPASVTAMTDSDLDVLARTKPSTPGLGKEIAKRRAAGTWKPSGSRGRREHNVFLKDTTTTRARTKALRVFGPPSRSTPDALDGLEGFTP